MARSDKRQLTCPLCGPATHKKLQTLWMCMACGKRHTPKEVDDAR